MLLLISYAKQAVFDQIKVQSWYCDFSLSIKKLHKYWRSSIIFARSILLIIISLAIIFSKLSLNSHAVGMALAQPLGFEIDFVRNPFSGSAAWFFVIILNFIFIPIFEIKVREKKILDTKKIWKLTSTVSF